MTTSRLLFRSLATFAAVLGLAACENPARQSEVASVELSQTELSLGPAETAALVATVRDAEGRVLTDRAVRWTSGDDLVATVAAGQVSGIRFGVATITASAGGRTASAQVTVTATQPPHIAGWWRMQSFAGKAVPATYFFLPDQETDRGIVDVTIRLDSARLELRGDGKYPFRQYCFSELHDTLLRFRYCWGDHGIFRLPAPGVLSFTSEYIQNLVAAGNVTAAGTLALVEPVSHGDEPVPTVWVRRD